MKTTIVYHNQQQYNRIVLDLCYAKKEITDSVSLGNGKYRVKIKKIKN